MPSLASVSRRDTALQAYPWYLLLLIPLAAVGLQSFVTLHFIRFGIVDLPLLVTIYFATTRRNPVGATISGAIVGLLQDALTQQPLGIFGICKTMVGYLAASLGERIDTDNHGARLLLTFIFTMFHSGMYWLLMNRLLAQPMVWNWVHELIRGGVNAALGVLLYALLDLARQREF